MPTKLDLAYRAETQKVRDALMRFAANQWNGLGSWRDADYERMLKVLVPRIEAGQQKISDLTAAYIRRLAVEEFGSIRNGLPFSASTEALRGVSAAEVYHRPFASSYTALSEGKPVSVAISAGAERLADLISTGMQLAKTRSARNAIGRSRFQGFQRVLTGRENCALCVIASTQRYHRGDLLPIHPGCDCDCKPYYGEFDQQVINPTLLDEAYAEIATHLDHVSVGRDARDLGLGKTDAKGRPLSDFTDLIVTHEHGEIGPLLSWRDYKFTSAEDIAALS